MTGNRPPSRGEIRRMAAQAFATRSRLIASHPGMREPDAGETALSASEIRFGLDRGIFQPFPPAAPASHTRAAINSIATEGASQ